MSLSSELISQFVKSTKDEVIQKSESTVYGQMVEYQGRMYVRIDGSDRLTPTSSTTDAKAGDRVSVMIKDHSAIVTGNITSPAARLAEVKDLGNQIGEFETVMAHQVVAEDIDAINARISNLKATVGTFSSLTTDELAAVTAQIETIQSKIVNADHLTAMDVNAVNADIENLRATFGSFISLSTSDLDAVNADIDNLKAYNANFTYVSTESLKAVKADIENLNVNKASVESLKAVEADIENLYANKASIDSLTAVEADIDDLYANKASIDSLTAVEADIDDLYANKLSATDANLKYANIDFSNIGKAAMEYFYANSGLIKDVVVGDETITGELVGVTIKGDLIEGNTIKADKLVIKGENGLYYKLNTDGVTTEAEQTAYNSINGNVILAKSITASKISVSDLVAFGATIGGFKITDNSIYSGVKETADNTTRGIYIDNEGQLSLGDSNQYLRYTKDQNGDFNLEISAKSLRFGTSNHSVEDEIKNVQDTIDGLAIGGRNLLRNSRHVTLSSNNNSLYPVSYTTEIEGGREFRRYIRTETSKNPTTMSLYSAIPVTNLTEHLTGKEITLSFLIRCSHDTSVSIMHTWYINGASHNLGPSTSHNVGTTWVRLYQTIIIDLDYEIVSSNILRFNPLQIVIPSGEIENFYMDVCEWKVELGNKATDWTPAPEDVDSKIEEASKVATNYMNFDETDGLVVGNMTADTLGNNVRIDNDSVDIRSGSNVLAMFAANLISLGKAAANAVIELCGGVGRISADKADDSDSIFNRLWITAKNMFLKGNQIDLTTSTQYDNPSQSYSESAYSTIGCISNVGAASGTASSSFQFIAVNNPNSQRAGLYGYAGNVDGSGISGWVSIGVSNSSKNASYTFDVDGFKTTEGSIYAGGNISTASGMQANASIKITSKANGYYLTDSSGASYPGVYDNGSNLWIGSSASNSVHHVGKTYISSGYNDSAGNLTIYVAVPNASNNNSALYGVFHAGYLDVGKATTGTLPIARGGTGGTSTGTARVNIGAMGATKVGSFYGLMTPDGSTSAWIRTTSNGLIPYESGNSGSLGTAGWNFNNIYMSNTGYKKNGVQILTPIKLWSGTMSVGGSATITNLDKYYGFIFVVSSYNEQMIGVRTTTSSSFSAYSSADLGGNNGSWVYKASCSVSGTKLTLSNASRHKLLTSGSSHSGSQISIKEIWGIF